MARNPGSWGARKVRLLAARIIAAIFQSMDQSVGFRLKNELSNEWIYGFFCDSVQKFLNSRSMESCAPGSEESPFTQAIGILMVDLAQKAFEDKPWTVVVPVAILVLRYDGMVPDKGDESLDKWIEALERIDLASMDAAEKARQATNEYWRYAPGPITDKKRFGVFQYSENWMKKKYPDEWAAIKAQFQVIDD